MFYGEGCIFVFYSVAGGQNAAEHICRSLLGRCRFRIVFYAIMFYGAGDHEQPAGYEPGDGAGHRPRHSLATCQL